MYGLKVVTFFWPTLVYLNYFFSGSFFAEKLQSNVQIFVTVFAFLVTEKNKLGSFLQLQDNRTAGNDMQFFFNCFSHFNQLEKKFRHILTF